MFRSTLGAAPVGVYRGVQPNCRRAASQGGHRAAPAAHGIVPGALAAGVTSASAWCRRSRGQAESSELLGRDRSHRDRDGVVEARWAGVARRGGEQMEQTPAPRESGRRAWTITAVLRGRARRRVAGRDERAARASSSDLAGSFVGAGGGDGRSIAGQGTHLAVRDRPPDGPLGMSTHSLGTELRRPGCSAAA